MVAHSSVAWGREFSAAFAKLFWLLVLLVTLSDFFKQEAKGIWRRLHQMTPRTRHVAYTAADLSRVTDTADIGNSSQHLMHSMQPKMSASSPVLLNLFHCWDPLNATDVVWDPHVKIEKVCAPE